MRDGDIDTLSADGAQESDSHQDLRTFAERAAANGQSWLTADDFSGFGEVDKAYLLAANPQAILDLLDERDRLRDLGERTYRELQAADSRVAALEELVKEGLAIIPHLHEHKVWQRKAERALLNPPRKPGCIYQHPHPDHGCRNQDDMREPAAPSEPHAYEAEADGRCVTCGQYGALIHTDPAALPAEATYRVIERLDRPGNRADGQRGER